MRRFHAINRLTHSGCALEVPRRVSHRIAELKVPIKQRDLTRAMKAARAAGITTFELVDTATGLIFRATKEENALPANEDLDAELRQFEARLYG